MENKADDEIRKKWEQEAKDKLGHETEATQRPKKRPRAIGYRNDADDVMNDLELGALLVGAGDKSSSTTAKRSASRNRRAAGTRARSRITEATEEEHEVVEVD